MKKRIFLLFCISFLSIVESVFGQATRKSGWITVYSDQSKGLKLEVQFKTLKDNCGNGTTPTHSFSYKLTSPQNNDYYIVWKMNYLNCDGEPYCQERSIDLNGKTEGRIEDPEYLITASSILDTILDVQKSNYRRESNKPFDLKRTLPTSSVIPMDSQKSIAGSDSLFNRNKSTFRQSGQIGVWQTLFRDQSKNVRIELKIEQKKDSCGDGMVHTHTYSYRMDPTYSTLPPYLIWKMDFVDCDGHFRSQYRTLDLDPIWTRVGGDFEDPNDKFLASEIKTASHGATYSNVPNNKSEIVLVKSIPPDGINGSDYLMYGASTELSVKGGVLGYNASWVWYESKCGIGKPIGQGPSIKVKPNLTTMYFVRAEARNDTSACVSLIVNVDNKSKKPQSIKADAIVVCKGSDAKLDVVGGALGKDALWIWTKDRCDGPEVGRGATLTTTVYERTTFFVKAVGPSNTTDCVSETINVSEPMADPSRIESSLNKEICEGESVSFTVIPASGNPIGTWYWKTESCGFNGLSIGEGNTIQFRAQKSTTIHVFGKNICGETKCTSTTLAVSKKSIAPSSISAPSRILKGQKTSYVVKGGQLGTGAQWLWWKNDPYSKPFRSGGTLHFKARKPTTLYVRAVGKCNNTDPAKILINPIQMRTMENRYSSEDYPNKSFSVGMGLGFQADANTATVSGISPFLIEASNGGLITDTLNTNKSAYVINLPIFPLMKEKVSIGVIPEFNYSYVNSYIDSDVALAEEFNLDYEEYTFKIILDAAYGSNGFKLFSRYGISYSQLDEIEPYPDVDPTFDPIKSIIQYPDVIRHEDIHVGLRLGNYIRKKRNPKTGIIKPTVWYDLYYIVRKSSVQKRDDDQSASLTFGDPATGYGLSIWKQNKFKIIFESFYIPDSNDGLVFHADGLATTIGFQLCLNGFR